MSLRLPSRDVPLYPSPGSLSLTSEAASAQRPTCTICHVRASAYTCPTCNIPYCSLACFKNPERHAACLGGFNKRAEEDVRRGVAASRDDEEDGERRAEREKVMEMLKRWQLGGGEDGSGGLDWEAILNGDGDDSDGDGESGGEDEGDGDDAHRYASLPTDEAQLLALLNEDQRQAFIEAVQKGRRGNHIDSDALRRLLDGEDRVWLWWESKADDEDMDSSSCARASPAFTSAVNCLATSSSSSSSPAPWQPGISFNLLAVLVAYTYTLLYLGLPSLSGNDGDGDGESKSDEDTSAARETVASLVPFLTSSPKTTTAQTLLSSASDVTLYILEHLGDQRRSANPTRLMLYLYERVEALASRAGITIGGGEDAVGDPVVTALHDISSSLFSKETATSRKIIFYAAHYQRGKASGGFQSGVLGRDESDHDDATQRVAEQVRRDRDHDGDEPASTGARHRHHRRDASLPTTLRAEMQRLRDELRAIEDDERFAAAYNWQQERGGGGGGGGGGGEGNRTLPRGGAGTTAAAAAGATARTASSATSPMPAPGLSPTTNEPQRPKVRPLIQTLDDGDDTAASEISSRAQRPSSPQKKPPLIQPLDDGDEGAAPISSSEVDGATPTATPTRAAEPTTPSATAADGPAQPRTSASTTAPPSADADSAAPPRPRRTFKAAREKRHAAAAAAATKAAFTGTVGADRGDQDDGDGDK